MDKSNITFLYDSKLKRPACVLLQVAAKCDWTLLRRFFPAVTWLTNPTNDMKRYSGTKEEWKLIAGQTKATVLNGMNK